MMANSVSNVILTETTLIFFKTFNNSLLTVNGKGTKSRKRFNNRSKTLNASLITKQC